ncbi:MAG: alkaline phosphatase [Bacteroidales bacterium]|nr:alkaline phosphatase [Bacteroidales bacterium]
MIRKTFLTIAALAALALSCIAGNDVKPTKNVIIMIPDGTSTGVLTASRWYKQYVGMDMKTLNLDPYLCGFVRSSLTDSPIVASSGAASAYMTGVITRANNISTFPDENPNASVEAIDKSKTFFPAATVMEAAKIYRGKSVGVVATVEFPHATPAACAAHAPSRNSYDVIAPQMTGLLDVAIAGGSKYMNGQCRANLEARGIPYVSDRAGFDALNGDKGWALLAYKNLAYEIDRGETDEPSLAEMAAKAIEMLNRNKKGFVLMIEGSKVDYMAHSMDARGTISEFLAFDEAVKVALDFAKKDGNTTVVILPDHGTSGMNIGNDRYSHYYERDLSSLFMGIDRYKASCDVVARRIETCEPERVKEIFMDLTGIELSDEQHAKLMRLKGVKEYDYMEIANSENFNSYINKILNSKHHLGFVSGNHTGEDVFLAVYSPKGQRPEGWITNVQLNEYLCKVAGVKGKEAELNNTVFIPHNKLLEGLDFKMEDADKSIKQISWTDAAGRKVLVRQGEPWYTVDGVKKELPVSAVYIKEIDSFFLPQSIVR